MFRSGLSSQALPKLKRLPPHLPQRPIDTPHRPDIRPAFFPQVIIKTAQFEDLLDARQQPEQIIAPAFF